MPGVSFSLNLFRKDLAMRALVLTGILAVRRSPSRRPAARRMERQALGKPDSGERAEGRGGHGPS